MPAFIILSYRATCTRFAQMCTPYALSQILRLIAMPASLLNPGRNVTKKEKMYICIYNNTHKVKGQRCTLRKKNKYL